MGGVTGTKRRDHSYVREGQRRKNASGSSTMWCKPRAVWGKKGSPSMKMKDNAAAVILVGGAMNNVVVGAGTNWRLFFCSKSWMAVLREGVAQKPLLAAHDQEKRPKTLNGETEPGVGVNAGKAGGALSLDLWDKKGRERTGHRGSYEIPDETGGA